jgi:predicted TIM-barrel fold metal-dependent hydrolase
LPPVGRSHFSRGSIGLSRGKVSSDDGKQADVNFSKNFRYEDFPASWEPAARLKDQDRDDVEAEILFASPSRFFYGLTDEPFQRAILHSYNGWLHEFCSFSPKRLFGLPLISILDVEHAVADITEYAKLGFRGVQIPTRIKNSGYFEPRYDPMWSAAEEIGIVINVHTSTTQGAPRTRYENLEGPRPEDQPWNRGLGYGSRHALAQKFLAELIFSGVFERHPKLKIVCAEFDAGWVAVVLQEMEYTHHRKAKNDRYWNVNKLPPSECFKRNIFFTYQDDRAAVLTTPVFGQNNFMWASDYPHTGTTWPESCKTVDSNCEGIDPGIKRRLNRENANQLYNLALRRSSGCSY